MSVISMKTKQELTSTKDGIATESVVQKRRCTCGTLITLDTNRAEPNEWGYWETCMRCFSTLLFPTEQASKYVDCSDIIKEEA